MKGFFNYLLLEDRIKSSPVELISTPKIPRTLPDVLTIEEVDALIAAAEQNPTNGICHRNSVRHP
jgi:integrase/recombinase XerD